MRFLNENVLFLSEKLKILKETRVNDVIPSADWIFMEFIIAVMMTKFSCLLEKTPRWEFLWESCSFFLQLPSNFSQQSQLW